MFVIWDASIIVYQKRQLKVMNEMKEGMKSRDTTHGVEFSRLLIGWGGPSNG